MFKKLNASFDELKAVKGDHLYGRIGVQSEGKFMGIQYNNAVMHCNGLDRILSKLPVDKFAVQYMSINTEVPPHVDEVVNTAINIYLNTGGYATTFHTEKEGANRQQLPNQKGGYICAFRDVEEVCSFTAKDGDAYILDVTKLHSVHGGIGKERSAICINTTIPFSEVVEILKEEI